MEDTGAVLRNRPEGDSEGFVDIVTLQPVFAKGVNVADGISLVDAATDQRFPIYDLSGRQVPQPKRGLYIKNGKKYLRK